MRNELTSKAAVYALVVVLVALNLYQCYNSFQKSRQLKGLSERVMRAEGAALIERNRFEAFLSYQFEINPVMIDDVCFKTGITLPNNTLCLFIPPFVCGACLEQECSIIENKCADFSVALLAPSGRDKNLIARYSAQDNIVIISYDPSLLDDVLLRNFDGVVCFFHTKQTTTSFFIPNIDFPLISEQYYAHIRHEYDI